MAKFELDAEELRPLIKLVLDEVLEATNSEDALLKGRLAFLEAEAAALLGVAGHVLRDARLRGEIIASRVGGRISYTPEELKAYLQRNRWEQP